MTRPILTTSFVPIGRLQRDFQAGSFHGLSPDAAQRGQQITAMLGQNVPE